MSQINDGGPAFPADVQHYDAVRGEWEELPPQGMSLRDWFAGMAIKGLLANCWIENALATPVNFAKTAYECADAMLAERKAKP